MVFRSLIHARIDKRYSSRFGNSSTERHLGEAHHSVACAYDIDRTRQMLSREIFDTIYTDKDGESLLLLEL
jgi:hypothetical protein